MTHVIEPFVFTISNPEWIIERVGTRGAWRHRVCYITGLEDLMGYGDGSSVPIDASIAPIIMELNRRGYATSFCCSHLPEDHIGGEGSLSGYILFTGNGAPSHEIAPTGTDISWNHTHWQFSNNPDLCRKQWNELAACLGVDSIYSDTPPTE